ncbi:acyltransferase [bacterium]|nr:acyltransferase [bacterium]
MSDSTGTALPGRIDFLDNLRTFIIFLVVLLHSGLVYEKSVFTSFIWIVADSATCTAAPVIRTVLDIFIMPLLFFVSGYLAPMSLKRRSGGAFVLSKFRRLMVPWIAAVLTLLPIYKWLFLYSRNLPQQHWTTYFHWSNGVWGQNWLWFLPVLFMFDIVIVLISKIRMKYPKVAPVPSIALVFFLGLISSVCMDLFHLQGWTKTPVLDFQNERLLIYLLVFLLGAHFYRLRIFESGRNRNTLLLFILCIGWIPVWIYTHFTMRHAVMPNAFIVNETADRLLIWVNYHLALLCFMVLGLEAFRRFLNKQDRFMAALNRNSYSVYIIHTVVMGSLAILLLHTTLPSPVKFALLSVSAFLMSHFIAYLYGRVIRAPLTALPSSFMHMSNRRKSI